MVFQPECMASIVSFLQEALPAYIPVTKVTNNQAVIDLYSKIQRNILVLLCRIVTCKESEVFQTICHVWLQIIFRLKIYQKVYVNSLNFSLAD